MKSAPRPPSASSSTRRSPRASATSPWVRIGRSGIHGRGLYARTAIPDGTRVIEYLGEKITKAEARRREEQRLTRLHTGGDGTVTIFHLNRRHDLDGRTARNFAKLINHSCAPNCRAENRRGHIWIVAKRDIPAGEELTFDYGFPLAEWRLHPCRCGARDCPGYIVAHAQHRRLRKILRAERRQQARDGTANSKAVSSGNRPGGGRRRIQPAAGLVA